MKLVPIETWSVLPEPDYNLHVQTTAHYACMMQYRTIGTPACDTWWRLYVACIFSVLP